MYKTKDTPALSDLTTFWNIYFEEATAYKMSRANKRMYEELRGVGDTRIYVWGDYEGELLLAVSTDNPGRFKRLIKIPGMRIYSGSVLRFSVALLDTVAQAVKAKKKRVLSEAAQLALKERMTILGKRRLTKAAARSSLLKPTIPPQDDPRHAPDDLMQEKGQKN